MSDTIEHAELAQRRSEIYGLLAMVFGQEPSGALLERLSDPGILASLGSCGVVYRDGLWERDADERTSALAVEYARLFLGPGPHLGLQESVARGEGQFWGAHTCDVVNCYARGGYALDPAWKDLPDHLAVELQFLAFLAQREAACWQRADAGQARAFAAQQLEFLTQHPRQWIPGVVQQVAEQACAAFYRAFADLLGRTLDGDALHLQDLCQAQAAT